MTALGMRHSPEFWEELGALVNPDVWEGLEELVSQINADGFKSRITEKLKRAFPEHEVELDERITLADFLPQYFILIDRVTTSISVTKIDLRGEYDYSERLFAKQVDDTTKHIRDYLSKLKISKSV